MKLWTVCRYDTAEGKPIRETRIPLCPPLPDKKGMQSLAASGNRTAKEEGASYLFQCEESKDL